MTPITPKMAQILAAGVALEAEAARNREMVRAAAALLDPARQSPTKSKGSNHAE